MAQAGHSSNQRGPRVYRRGPPLSNAGRNDLRDDGLFRCRRRQSFPSTNEGRLERPEHGPVSSKLPRGYHGTPSGCSGTRSVFASVTQRRIEKLAQTAHPNIRSKKSSMDHSLAAPSQADQRERAARTILARALS